MKRKLIILGGVALATVGLVYALAGIGAPILWIFSMRQQIDNEAAYLQKPEVYGPVAEVLPLYGQSDAALRPECFGSAWFPEPLRSHGGGRGMFLPQGPRIEFGGGFCHFGYRATLDKTMSAAGTNIWHLYFYMDESPDVLLTRVSLPVASHLSAEELTARVSAGYDALLAAHPDDAAMRKGKVLFLIRLGQAPAALAACREWIDAQPEAWLPRFTYAHLRCRAGEAEAAASEFVAWVDGRRTFCNGIYLALFNAREGRREAALAALRLAAAQKFVDSPGAGTNKFNLAYSGALAAFGQKDYALCRTLCGKALSKWEDEEYWRRKILKLQAAALVLQGDAAAARQVMAKAPRTALVGEEEGEAAFQAAIEAGDTGFLACFDRWRNRYQDIYTPYEEDEVPMFGRHDIPSPYAPDWRKRAGLAE
jgi:hypothetical protein